MRRTLLALAVTALALPMVGRAATAYDEPNYEDQTVKATKSTVGIMGDIGVDNYNREVANQVDTGVAYGARVDLSPTRIFGLELSYAGAVNNMSSRLSSDGRLITNQVGGDVRLNMVPPGRDLPLGIRPFVLAGAAYHRIDTDNFTPGIQDNINAFALPVGLGVDTAIGAGLLLGARFTYNFLFNEVDKFSGRNTDNWAATVNLGARIGR